MMSACRRMPGSTENMDDCAIWHLRSSLNKNGGFSSLSQTSRLVRISSICISSIPFPLSKRWFFFIVSNFQASSHSFTVVSALVETFKNAEIYTCKAPYILKNSLLPTPTNLNREQSRNTCSLLLLINYC